MSAVNATPTDEQPQRGFQIRGRFYPIADVEKLGDPALVRAVTGLSWDAYLAGLGYIDPAANDDDELEDLPDENDVLAGVVAIAVQHVTNWPRDKVTRFVTNLSAGEVEGIGFDEPEPELAPDPELEKLPPTSELDGAELDSAPPMMGSGEPIPGETVEPSSEPQD